MAAPSSSPDVACPFRRVPAAVEADHDAYVDFSRASPLEAFTDELEQALLKLRAEVRRPSQAGGSCGIGGGGSPSLPASGSAFAASSSRAACCRVDLAGRPYLLRLFLAPPDAIRAPDNRAPAASGGHPSDSSLPGLLEDDADDVAAEEAAAAAGRCPHPLQVRAPHHSPGMHDALPGGPRIALIEPPLPFFPLFPFSPFPLFPLGFLCP